MDLILVVIGLVLIILGLAGCIVPGLPGPPLNFIAVLLLQWAYAPFDFDFLMMWGVITIIVVVLDYYLPVLVSKKFGASREGILGSIVGLLIGLFFPPIGMIAGLILGAIVGDIISGKSLNEAIKSGLGSALGTLMSVGLKLVVSVMLSWYFFKAVINYYT